MKPKTKAASVAGVALAVVIGTAFAQFQSVNGPHRSKNRPANADKMRPPANPPALGDPLPALDAASLAAFAEGMTEFQSAEVAAGGLGPIFNGASCLACHVEGALGGAGQTTVTRFGLQSKTGFDPLTNLGGSLLQSQAIAPQVLEAVPPQANVVALRRTTPLFGAGLIEAISDTALLQAAKVAQPDGIRGRAALVTDITTGQTRVGRFGWKAQQATLLAFAGDAYLNEMGITNRFFPTENAPNGNTALLAAYDLVADPEDVVDPATGLSDIDRAANFMRYLAPPTPLRQTANAVVGSRLFTNIGCAACHTPTLLTGANANPALANKPVALYSDLLLHDMGTLGDGIAQGAAGPTEMRTAPLWGLRVRVAYLHDGRAAKVSDAIVAHDGQALTARKRFSALSATDQSALLEFLNTL
jgi:CxxC motif-containing protein (DUF1111 family)